jgi:hypothetical protein
MIIPIPATRMDGIVNCGTGGGKVWPTIPSLPLAKLAVAHPPLEDVTVIWVVLPVEGEVMVTVNVVEPDPEAPDGTGLLTVTVHAEFEETAVIVIGVFGATPVQENAHDCTVTEPATTESESIGGVISPPQTEVVAATGTAVPNAKIASAAMANMAVQTLEFIM